MKFGFAVLMLSLCSGFALLAIAPKLEAQSNAKEEDRLYNSALVIKEAMGMKSRIPQKLLDKAALPNARLTLDQYHRWRGGERAPERGHLPPAAYKIG